eukprot:CAMPEP_0204132536 /NCGR_PEP_ID=MMETSP0361-20130328/14578_1 /ASSEMBLY_ACC=CAM_ASM_000343 /TAXON_ID=268821 /ORGANISM="Scrippsiella Hangoei, Strain SHTV-5" /LENGTH=108 /DNA_ID=CAMNT_0051085453 /DNA_START=94 /DNA_END=417 /DNA_ORIENTATION=+
MTLQRCAPAPSVTPCHARHLGAAAIAVAGPPPLTNGDDGGNGCRKERSRPLGKDLPLARHVSAASVGSPPRGAANANLQPAGNGHACGVRGAVMSRQDAGRGAVPSAR